MHLTSVVGTPSSAASSVIARLLAPLSPDLFFRDYWEQRYCLVTRGDAAYYETLLTRRDLDALLHHYRQADGAAALGARVTLVKSSERNALRQPTPTTEFGVLDITGLYEAYRRGYTLIIDMVQTRWPPIAALCQSLEALLHFGVQANVYVTPSGAQGFAPHFDTHDVFVLQLAGSKAWRIYGDGSALPMADGHGHPSRESLGPPAVEFTLRQGDLLYIPRGIVHEAMTTDDSSVHLTVGIHVWRWADLLREAVRSLAETDVRLRKSLPIGLLANDGANAVDLDTRLRELLHACAETADARDALQRMGRRLFERREPVPDGHFESLDRLDAITGQTWLQRRTGMLCSVLPKADKVTIAFPGGSVTGPATLDRALRFVSNADVFQVRDLPGPEWAPLSATAQVVLAKRLVRAGLLAVSDS